LTTKDKYTRQSELPLRAEDEYTRIAIIE